MTQSQIARPHWLARSLGWLALGLGAAQLVAPRQLGRLMGFRGGRLACATLRLMGLREVASGLGVLRGRRARGWLRARIAGDALDTVLLLRALRSKRGFPYLRRGPQRSRLGATLLAVGGVAALDVVAAALGRKRDPDEPTAAADRPTVTASITIDRPADEVYAFWRQVDNLPRFVPYLASVTATDPLRSRWQARMPGGRALSWEATLVEDEPGRRIVWKMQGGGAKLAMLDSLEVRFLPAPAGQGTEVRITVWGRELYAPRAVQKWLRKLPERFWVQQLRRCKQLMELGEIPASDASMFFRPHAARPDRDPASAPLAPPAVKAVGAAARGARS